MNPIFTSRCFITVLGIVFLLTFPMHSSAQATRNAATNALNNDVSQGVAGGAQTHVATVFREPFYLEQFYPVEADSKRKEINPSDFDKWLLDYRAARLYDVVWSAVKKKYVEREKLIVSDEELSALKQSVERSRSVAQGGKDESPFPSPEYRGIAIAMAQASLLDWKVCKSLHEKYGGRVGIGSLGAWVALDGQHALLQSHYKAGDIAFHHAEIETAFWQYAQRDNFADAYPKGERLRRLLATPVYLQSELSREHPRHPGSIVSHVDANGSVTESRQSLSETGQMNTGFDYGDASKTNWKGNVQWRFLRRTANADIYQIEWTFKPHGGVFNHKEEELSFDGKMPSKLIMNEQWVITIEANKRERIGSALGQDIFRDQLQDNPPSYHQVTQLFMALAMERFEREHSSAFEMTDDEIRAGVVWMEAQYNKQGGASWEHWQSRSKELRSSVDKRLSDIKRQLEKPGIPDEQQEMLRSVLRVTALESTHPHACEVWFMMRNRKFEKYLYDHYDGGRIIHQQFGPEALDARKNLLLQMEKAGKFEFSDLSLRKLAFDYWERPVHPGGFHTDRRLLEFPWTTAYQEMIREKEAFAPAETK